MAGGVAGPGNGAARAVTGGGNIPHQDSPVAVGLLEEVVLGGLKSLRDRYVPGQILPLPLLGLVYALVTDEAAAVRNRW